MLSSSGSNVAPRLAPAIPFSRQRIAAINDSKVSQERPLPRLPHGEPLRYQGGMPEQLEKP